MKLLRCYVQNYGKLHEFKYDFNDNLNIILQENGWGKSTFASFIKAMLFGLPVTTKRDLDENERAKYTPWQGGKFGGWLELTLKGKSYRIERFFGTTLSKDTVTIYDLQTNTPLPDNDFIEKTLGINADTFMRSTYIEQGLFSNASDDSIRAKLGKLVKNDENIDLSEVDKKLQEKETSLQYQRGKGGKIYQLESELQQVRKTIDDCETAKQEADRLNQNFTENQQKIAEINAQINILRSKIQSINDERTAQAVYAHYNSLKNELQKIDNERKKLLEFFKNDPPSKLQLEELLDWQREYNKAVTTLENYESSINTIKLQKLKDYFKNGVPTKNELEKANANLLKLNNMHSSIQLSQTVISKTSSPFKILSFVLFGLGALALLALIIQAIVVPNTTITIILAIVSALCLLGGACMIFLSKSYQSPAKITAMNNLNQINENSNEMRNELTEFVSRFGESTQDFSDSIYNIKFNLKTYKDLLTEEEQRAQNKEKMQKNQQRYYNALVQYYSQFFNPADRFTSNHNELQANVERLEILNKNYEDKENEIKNFVENNKIDENSQKNEENIDLSPLENKINQLELARDDIIHQNSVLNSSLINYSNKADKLGFYKDKEIELEEELQTAKANWQTIKHTREYLDLARNNLTSKYLTPLCDAFKMYAKKFLGDDFENVSIDTKLEVKIEKLGEKKQTKYFSHGIRDIIELCIRLALIKTLFEDETPPLIMDDPFYNLDDKKTESGLKLLQELSKEFQVIYLVCHSSRT